MPNVAKRPANTAVKPVSPLRGRLVCVMTPEERAADMKDFGKEIRKSKEKARDFLQRAGILDETGALAEPYRS